MGRGHGGAAVGAVGAVGEGGRHGAPRCPQIHPGGPVVGKAGETAVAVDGRHGDHVGQVVGGGIGEGAAGAVARGGDKEDASAVGPVDCVIEPLRIAAASPGVVGGDQIQAMACLEICEVIDRTDRIGGGATRGAEEFAGQQRDIPVDASDPQAIAALSADGAGHMGAMVIGRAVINAAVVGDKIPTIAIIDVAIAIIIDAISADFSWIGAHIADQIRVVDLKPFINDPHHHIGRTGEAPAPGLRGLGAKGIDRAGALAIEAPGGAVGHGGIVADGLGLNQPVFLHEADAGPLRQLLDGLLGALARRQIEHLQGAGPLGLHGTRVNRFPQPQPQGGPGIRPLLGDGARVPTHQQAIEVGLGRADTDGQGGSRGAGVVGSAGRGRGPRGTGEGRRPLAGAAGRSGGCRCSGTRGAAGLRVWSTGVEGALGWGGFSRRGTPQQIIRWAGGLPRAQQLREQGK